MTQSAASGAIAALAVTDTAHARGADLGVLIADLLGLAHLLTRLKSVPALATSNALPEAERTRGLALAAGLSIPWLGRLWQMLLKGVAEVEAAPDRRAAAEMIIIRLCHVADMPPPGDLIKKLEQQAAQNSMGGSVGGGSPGGTRAVANGAPMQAVAAPRAITFQDVVALAGAKHDVMLYAHLRQSVHLVKFAPPVIEMRLEPDAPRDMAQRLGALLEAETNRRWTIVISQAAGEPTIADGERQAENAARQHATDHPLVRAIMEAFPGARIEKLHAAPEPIADEAPPDWLELAPPDDVYNEEED
jgi:DNA polymerase-3 subunit gamma/tau